VPDELPSGICGGTVINRGDYLVDIFGTCGARLCECGGDEGGSSDDGKEARVHGWVKMEGGDDEELF
jgi:hypothetical protein